MRYEVRPGGRGQRQHAGECQSASCVEAIRQHRKADPLARLVISNGMWHFASPPGPCRVPEPSPKHVNLSAVCGPRPDDIVVCEMPTAPALEHNHSYFPKDLSQSGLLARVWCWLCQGHRLPHTCAASLPEGATRGSSRWPITLRMHAVAGREPVHDSSRPHYHTHSIRWPPRRTGHTQWRQLWPIGAWAKISSTPAVLHPIH